MAFDVSPEDGKSDMISVTISLYLRVHGGVDVRVYRHSHAHEVAVVFFEKT